jgi:hypothetical protein
VVRGTNPAGEWAETTFSVVVDPATFGPVLVTIGEVTGSIKIGGDTTGTESQWSANPSLTSLIYQWEADTGSGYAEVSGKSGQNFGTLTEDLDLALLRRRETADNGIGDPVVVYTDPITVTYNAPAATGAPGNWDVTIANMPATFDAKTLFAIDGDADFSGATWALSGVPVGVVGPYAGGVMEATVYVQSDGTSVDLTIGADGVLDLDHDELLSNAAINVHCTNSDGTTVVTITLSVIGEAAGAGIGFMEIGSTFFVGEPGIGVMEIGTTFEVA